MVREFFAFADRVDAADKGYVTVAVTTGGGSSRDVIALLPWWYEGEGSLNVNREGPAEAGR